MAARRPLLAHDAQHLVMGTVEPGPRAERLLDSKVKPFLWREASLHDPEVDPVERGGVAQGRERIERDAGTAPVHRDKQHTARMGMDDMGALEKRDAALVAGQGKVGRDQGDAHTVVPKLLEHRESLGFSARSANLVIGSEAPRQRGCNAFARLRVYVDEEQHRKRTWLAA